MARGQRFQGVGVRVREDGLLHDTMRSDDIFYGSLEVFLMDLFRCLDAWLGGSCSRSLDHGVFDVAATDGGSFGQ